MRYARDRVRLDYRFVYSVVTSVTAASYHANLRRGKASSRHSAVIHLDLICFKYHRLFSLSLSFSFALASAATSIHRRSPREESKRSGALLSFSLILLPALSNASSSAEDERWLAHKSYSQMPSERNGAAPVAGTERLRRRRR